jgi:2'-hydroxyisoflavone reductase
LGGTRFLGPHMVDEAKRRGWRVTLFNRGKSNPDLFDNVEQLRGDRAEGDLAALEGREFDAVIDTSAYYPRAVREVLEVLDGHVDHYAFISTISVYADFSSLGLDEESELATLDDPTTEEVTAETYGGLKVLCEEAAREHFSGRLTIIRPGIVAGPRDHTDRFTYWPVRTARGGKMAVPGSPKDPVQYIDVRDLARWTVDTLAAETTGTFNAVVPDGMVSMGDLIDTCREIVDDPAEPVWVSEDVIAAQDDPANFPMWAPPSGDHRGIFTINSERAIKAGMALRSVEETVEGTLEWFESLPDERRQNLEAGPTPAQEQALLDALS